MDDRPQTAEQAMELAFDWANGKRSCLNVMMDVEGVSSDGLINRQETLRIVNEMDARTAEMWASIAASMASIPDQVRGSEVAKLAARALAGGGHA